MQQRQEQSCPPHQREQWLLDGVIDRTTGHHARATPLDGGDDDSGIRTETTAPDDDDNILSDQATNTAEDFQVGESRMTDVPPSTRHASRLAKRFSWVSNGGIALPTSMGRGSRFPHRLSGVSGSSLHLRKTSPHPRGTAEERHLHHHRGFRRNPPTIARGAAFPRRHPDFK